MTANKRAKAKEMEKLNSYLKKMYGYKRIKGKWIKVKKTLDKRKDSI